MNNEQSIAETSDAQWQRSFLQLLEWLQTQKGGVVSFYEFQRRALALREDHKGHAALFRLLADLSGRFADRFDGEPLDLSTASRALEVLTGCVREAASLRPGRNEDILDLLNRIGLADLSPIE